MWFQGSISLVITQFHQEDQRKFLRGEETWAKIWSLSVDFTGFWRWQRDSSRWEIENIQAIRPEEVEQVETDKWSPKILEGKQSEEVWWFVMK
jgi:hypothetical protein